MWLELNVLSVFKKIGHWLFRFSFSNIWGVLHWLICYQKQELPRKTLLLERPSPFPWRLLLFSMFLVKNFFLLIKIKQKQNSWKHFVDNQVLPIIFPPSGFLSFSLFEQYDEKQQCTIFFPWKDICNYTSDFYLYLWYLCFSDPLPKPLVLLYLKVGWYNSRKNWRCRELLYLKGVYFVISFEWRISLSLNLWFSALCWKLFFWTLLLKRVSVYIFWEVSKKWKNLKNNW